ncbi:MAG: hypothetical protein ACXADY_15300 [Candidatus Hodarchaeales archaeon]|jgi:hypothetical protein
MERKDSYIMMLETLIHGLLPNATPPVLGKIYNVFNDLKLDCYAFGKWFDEIFRNNSLFLQEIDLVCMLYQYIVYDFKTYMQEQYQESIPELQMHCDYEDTKFTNWQGLTQWIEELEERNPQAAEDGFVGAMYAFYG